jgi:uncharacterized protein
VGHIVGHMVGHIAGSPQPPRWPYHTLNSSDLVAQGWRPTALREFVLKVHQRCNLACDYCYVYTSADRSWRHKPARMSSRVWSAAVERIAEHASQHSLTSVSVVLHGGEPLLAGVAELASIASAVRTALSPWVAVNLGMQTNGVLLSEAVLRVLAAEDIRVGVSLDGSAIPNDTHRRHVAGHGSYAQAERGVRLLAGPQYRSVFGGLLCTVDPRTDPVACYEALLSFGPPAIDFLLPHANWSTRTDQGSTQYGDWLVSVFDRWYDAPGQETRIRLFESVISLLLGGVSRSEHVGPGPVATAVVESDGAIEQTDALKSAYPGAPATGLSVLTDSFDAALAHPGIVARQIGLAALCQTCQECHLKLVCGAGHYAHRYHVATGFLNPSVYCLDLQTLIGHVRRRVLADLAVRRAAAETARPL